MKVQELFEAKNEAGFYVLNGRPGEWEVVAGPFNTKDEAVEVKRKQAGNGEDYLVRKLKKRP